MSLRAPALGLAIALSAAFAAAALAADAPPTVFRVDQVDDDVLAWIPWRGDWTPLYRGLDLPVGSLVQCLQPTTLRMHALGRRKGTDDVAASFNLTLTSPGMFRVYPDLARQIRMVESVDVDTGDVGRAGFATGKKVDPPLYDLEDAWRRESGVGMFLKDLRKLAADALRPLSLRPPANDAPMSMRNMVRDLIIKYPSDGLVFFRGPREASSTLVATWEVDGGSPETPWVEVYLWRRDAERGMPVTTTNSTVVPLTLDSPGGWFLQLSSTDRRFQSKPIYFVIE